MSRQVYIRVAYKHRDMLMFEKDIRSGITPVKGYAKDRNKYMKINKSWRNKHISSIFEYKQPIRVGNDPKTADTWFRIGRKTQLFYCWKKSELLKTKKGYFLEVDLDYLIEL